MEVTSTRKYISTVQAFLFSLLAYPCAAKTVFLDHLRVHFFGGASVQPTPPAGAAERDLPVGRGERAELDLGHGRGEVRDEAGEVLDLGTK